MNTYFKGLVCFGFILSNRLSPDTSKPKIKQVTKQKSTTPATKTPSTVPSAPAPQVIPSVPAKKPVIAKPKELQAKKPKTQALTAAPVQSQQKQEVNPQQLQAIKAPASPTIKPAEGTVTLPAKAPTPAPILTSAQPTAVPQIVSTPIQMKPTVEIQPTPPAILPSPMVGQPVILPIIPIQQDSDLIAQIQMKVSNYGSSSMAGMHIDQTKKENGDVLILDPTHVLFGIFSAGGQSKKSFIQGWAHTKNISVDQARQEIEQAYGSLEMQLEPYQLAPRVARDLAQLLINAKGDSNAIRLAFDDVQKNIKSLAKMGARVNAIVARVIQGKLIVANLGNSRAALFGKKGTFPVAQEHNSFKIFGGDEFDKNNVFIYQRDLTPDDEFFVLISAGVYSVLGSEKSYAYIEQFIKNGFAQNKQLDTIAKDLLNQVRHLATNYNNAKIEKGEKPLEIDDASIIIVTLVPQ